MDLTAIQGALKEKGIEGWLFYDFHNRDHLAYRILDLDFDKMTSRRWFYYIPAEGEPVRLVHRVERSKLDSLPGRKVLYHPWRELHQRLKEILGGPKSIAMQYSPLNNIPYTSIVDGGTVELIRSFGHEVVPSADLVQLFEAVIDEKGYQSHLRAGEIIQKIKNEAFAEIGRAISEKRKLTEYDIAQFILRRFAEENIDPGHDIPIVGINDHPANPHFEPQAEGSYEFKPGDMVLIDLWGKLKEPGSIYYDITWCGYIGDNPPEKYQEIFHVVRDARIAAVNFVRKRFVEGTACFGWEVDDACRNVVKEAGYGDFFIHRTGHSIGEEVHGNGVHIDNLETKDERQLVPGICFSIEPGIYLDGEMAARSEIDCFITLEGEVVVAGEEQMELIRIHAG
ncbi:MAG: M24 family metallopeptidase [Candidatus Krumholzibacteriota bacterium]|nr:M24 family metallopeptidase [Candidatus Krumholzibacteriota bacterium]